MIFPTDTDVNLATALKYIADRRGKDFEIKIKRKKRTNDQNAYLHVIFGKIGLELGYTIEEVKDVFKQKFLTYEKNGYKFTYKTSSLDTKEMTVFIDRIRNYCAKELSMYIPAPHEYQMLDQLRNELIEKAEWL